MRAITVREFGGPEVLESTEVDRPIAGPGQVLVEVALSGVNFLDVYQRTGASPLKPPFLAGVEGVGVVAEVGDGVADLRIGQRVGWFSGGQGSYADYTPVVADKAVPIPDGVTDEAAVAVLMQGVTAQYLATDTYPIQPGDPVLVHAAAGGVGRLLTQIAKLRGASVIATVSTDAKADIARKAGADHVLGYEDFSTQVKDLTAEGVAAVYDGVGATTFDGSLASLRPRGCLVIYGTASGPTPPLDIPRLNTGGSLYVTRPTVVHYTASAEELRRRTDEVFAWVADGSLDVLVSGTFPMSQIADAFTALESRSSTGKLVLTR